MLKSNLVFVALALSLVLGQTVDAAEQDSSGKDLLERLWAASKSGNAAEQAKIYAKAFQSVHEDGARDRAQELELLKTVNLGNYTLSGIKITEQGPVIVATYFAEVGEDLAGKNLPKRKAPRMTVFLRTEEGWQAVAHANLNPLHENLKPVRQ